MSGVVLTLLILATYRITRLAVSDKITDAPRTRLLLWASQGDHRHLRYLLACQWCVGVYVSGVMVLVGWATGLVPARMIWLAWPATAAGAGLCATVGG